MHSSVFVSRPTVVQVVVRNESGIGGALILIGPNYSAPLPPLKFGTNDPSFLRFGEICSGESCKVFETLLGELIFPESTWNVELRRNP